MKLAAIALAALFWSSICSVMRPRTAAASRPDRSSSATLALSAVTASCSSPSLRPTTPGLRPAAAASRMAARMMKDLDTNQDGTVSEIERLVGEMLTDKMQFDDAYARAQREWVADASSFSSGGQAYPQRKLTHG